MLPETLCRTVTDEEILALDDTVGDTLLVDEAERLDVVVIERKDVVVPQTVGDVDCVDIIVPLVEDDVERVAELVELLVNVEVVVEVAEVEVDDVFNGVALFVVDDETVAVAKRVEVDEPLCETDTVPIPPLAVDVIDCIPGEPEVENVAITERD